jgi:hypothetical protein
MIQLRNAIIGKVKQNFTGGEIDAVVRRYSTFFSRNRINQCSDTSRVGVK